MEFGISLFLKADKPKNLVYIHSSNCVNMPETWILKKYSFVDHVFTVYSKDYIAAHGIKINCGGRACKDCIAAGKKCYFRDGNKEINESLK